MNPYLVPGLARPDGPLCPFQVPDHEKYYVSVDNTEDAYRKFQQEIGDPHLLSTEGRLVVVSGPQRCGKSSLINRCAAWLLCELEKVDLAGAIFSLTDVVPTNRSVDDRILQVFDSMIDDLRRRKLMEDPDLNVLTTRRNNLDLAFRYLSTNLDKDQVLIILLPSADLVKEAVKYAELSRGKIVFFSETAYGDSVRIHWPNIHKASRMPPILLEVGPLEENDGWVFAKARQEVHANPNLRPFPKMTRNTMAQITGGLEISIGQLQTMLYDYYHHRTQLPQNNVAPSDEVTFEDFTKFYYMYYRNETRYPQ